MKLILLLFIPCITFGQNKYALIDKKMKQPILYTDSVTVEQVKQGYFPIENKNIDTLIANLQYLRGILNKRQRAKMESFELKASNSIITTKRVPYAYGDRYNSLAQTDNGQVQAKLYLISSDKSNKDNRKWIDRLLVYLKKNKSFYKEPIELTPKVYNVVVITE